MTRRIYIAAFAALLGGLLGCRTPLGFSPACPSGAVLGEDHTCHLPEADSHQIPFEAGYETRVTQGYFGAHTHDKELAYAVDFRCEKGTPVTASKKGRVLLTKSDSKTTCTSPKCLDKANYVIIDHGDGRYSEYYHLAPNSVVVEPGESVCSGEVIGLCGDTGYANGAHLHYSVKDGSGHTMPVRFDTADRQFEAPIPDTTYISTNRQQSNCRPVSYSKVSRSAFAHRGIVLSHPVPAVIQADRGPRTLRGRYFGDLPRVAVRLRREATGKAVFEACSAVNPSGGFSIQANWANVPPGKHWLILGGADGQCQLISGWRHRVVFR